MTDLSGVNNKLLCCYLFRELSTAAAVAADDDVTVK
jgi:hypothetical protein